MTAEINKEEKERQAASADINPEGFEVLTAITDLSF